MPTDLEAAIRDALHARAAATVPRETAPRPRRPGRHLPLLAAAAAAVLALAIAVVVSRAGTHRTPASGSPAFVGYRWNLIAVDSGSTHAAVPPGWHAYIAFGRDGHVQGDDTVNALGGTYRVSGAGYTVRDVSSTLVGYAGRDPRRVAVIFAVDAVFNGGGAVNAAEVTAQVRGARLTLSVPGNVLMLTRAGTAPDQAAPSTTTATSASG